MSKLQKSIERLLSKPVDFTWDELLALMTGLGFELRTSGGSSRKFYDPENGALLFIHEPHPAKVLKNYQIRAVIQFLRQERRIP